MGTKFMDGNVERELVFVQRAPTAGNLTGVVYTYRDLMREDDVECNEDGSPLAAATPTAAPPAAPAAEEPHASPRGKRGAK